MEEKCIRIFADRDQIEFCKQKLHVVGSSLSDLSNVLALVGNEVRLKIVYLLHTEKELCPCDLSDILQITVPAVSQHLRKLKDGGLVRPRKSAQTVYYSLTESNMQILKPFFKHIGQSLNLKTV